MSDEHSNDTIAWNENGRTFTVWKPDVLESEYLPKTFKHSNFASFVRQLNNYGFRKCHSDRYEFGVEGFERGKPELLTTLKRHDAPRTKKTGAGATGKKTGGGASARGGGGSQNQLMLNSGALELGAYGGLASEVEQLKRDRLLLLKEVMRLRETQSSQRDEVAALTNRLAVTESFQTQMRHFVQAVHDGENINSALRESGLAGFDAEAVGGPRKRRTAPRYLPAVDGLASTSPHHSSPMGLPPSPLSLEEIDDGLVDVDADAAATPRSVYRLIFASLSPSRSSRRYRESSSSTVARAVPNRFDRARDCPRTLRRSRRASRRPVRLRTTCPRPFDASFRSSMTSKTCLLYTSPSPRDVEESRMPSSA